MKVLFKHIMLVVVIFNAGFAYAGCNPNMSISKPDSIYADHNDGTVTDIETNLMWQKCSAGETYDNGSCVGVATLHNWKSALDWAQVVNIDASAPGYTDWRLPSVAELRSIVEKACENPSVNSTVFPGTAIAFYWSSSPYADNNEFAWVIFFADGGENNSAKDNEFNVRLVRGGR